MSFILARNASCHTSINACTSGGAAIVAGVSVRGVGPDVDDAGVGGGTWGAMEEDDQKTWVDDEASPGGDRLKAKSGYGWAEGADRT